MKKIIPRISTRGYYNLTNGKTIKNRSYFLYPKKDFKKFLGARELVIVVHGLRNDNFGAVAKVILAKNRLNHLGYRFPVVGFSYDSNTRGAHLQKHVRRAYSAGITIAQKNGRNLSIFIEDFKTASPNTKIRLMGHSLGSQVIFSMIENLAKKNENKKIIESVYFLGASIPRELLLTTKYKQLIKKTLRGKILNYYSPSDEVLQSAHNEDFVKEPLGLNGIPGKSILKYHQRLIHPENHRFASYIAVLNSFP